MAIGQHLHDGARLCEQKGDFDVKVEIDVGILFDRVSGDGPRGYKRWGESG